MNNSIKLYRHTTPTAVSCNSGASSVAASDACTTSTASAVTIGNFDGVHLGHQKLLSHLVAQAHQRQLSPAVMTFTPHPREFFALREQRPDLIPTRISTFRDKIMALQACGIERVYLERFNQDTAQMSAQDFIEKILVQRLNTRYLYVGEDFRFGHRRSGTIELLQEAAPQFGFEVETMADILDEQHMRYSSTELRNALAFGHIERANSYLGRPYTISAHVIHGKKLGRSIGFPTMNLAVMPRCALRSGIYIVSVLGLEGQTLPAIASLGVRPTVESDGQVLLEVHILNHSVSAYGKLVSVKFHQYVRDEEKFPDLPTMIDAIQKDVDIAQHYFSVHGL